MRIPFLFFTALTVLNSCAPPTAPQVKNRFSDPTNARIFQAGYDRDTKTLITYTGDANAVYRQLAAIQLGSVQDTAAHWKLENMLNDEEPTVSDAACFALGQLGLAHSIEALTSYAKQHNPGEPHGEVFVALGKLSAKHNLPNSMRQRVADAFHAYRPATENQFINWARGVLYLNRAGYTFREIHLDIRYHMQTCGAAARVVMAQGLATAPYDWVGENKEYFRQWLRSERSEEVRIPMMTLIAKLGDPDAGKLLTGYAMMPSAGLSLSIAAAQALNELGKITVDIPTTLLGHPAEQVAEIALALAAGRGLCPDSEAINQRMEGASAPLRALLLEAGIRCGNTDALEALRELSTSASDAYSLAAVMAVLARQPNETSAVFQKAVIESQVPVVRYTALSAILSSQRGFTKGFTREQWIAGWQTGDIGLQELLANWIAGHRNSAGNAAELTSLMWASMQTMTLPRDIETYDAAAAACTALGREVAPALRSGFRSIDWNFIGTLPDRISIEVETTAGTFSAELHTESAPATVAQFIRLTRDGFFNQKPVHRVVPNFVMQTGCPRGDGMGSLDEVIRSEFTLEPFLRGSIGMASAGKDTESCQWFVTHLPALHLDGRYTRFGTVLYGMEVVEKLRVGDLILSVKEVP